MTKADELETLYRNHENNLKELDSIYDYRYGNALTAKEVLAVNYWHNSVIDFENKRFIKELKEICRTA